jgi:CHASE1-domain containing sensor protein
MLANKSIRLIKSDLASVVSMALIYIVLGKLSLLLAIPPGYATAMFLPAGLAIAAVLLWGRRILPGIFLGSLILHLWVNFEMGHPLFSTVTLVALGIATGVLLQTVVAVSLVRFYVSFLLLAGPVASFIGASIGISALLFGGVIAPEAFLFSWLTWWVGDVIGVVIMTPLLLIFFAQPRQLWRQRVLTVAVPMLVSCVVVVVVFVRVSQSELERLEFQFRGESVEILEAVKSRFDGYVEELAALERFYAASTFVTRDEFRSFVSPALLRSPGLQVLEWLPRVPDSQRQQFESQMRNSGFFQYHLTEHDASQSLVMAGVRDEYFPVAYVEPYPGNESAIGYDVASSTVGLAALVQARDNGTVGVSAPIELLKFGAEQKGALLFFPLYENGDLPVTIALRQARLKGFMLAVFGYRYMLDAALLPFPKDTFLLSVLDVSDASSTVPLYGDESIVLNNNKQTVSWSGTISAGGRSLLLNFTPSAKYLDQHRT